MDTSEQKLARATKAMREVQKEIEELVATGPVVIDTRELLAFAAKLGGVLAHNARSEATVVRAPKQTWRLNPSDQLTAD